MFRCNADRKPNCSLCVLDCKSFRNSCNGPGKVPALYLIFRKPESNVGHCGNYSESAFRYSEVTGIFPMDNAPLVKATSYISMALPRSSIACASCRDHSPIHPCSIFDESCWKAVSVFSKFALAVSHLRTSAVAINSVSAEVYVHQK